MQTRFNVRFNSVPGQDLYLTGSCDALGSWDKSKAIPLTYTQNNLWTAEVMLEPKNFEYQYFLIDNREAHGIEEWEKRHFEIPSVKKHIIIYDDWLYPNLPEFNLNTKFFDIISPTVEVDTFRRYRKNTHRFNIHFYPLKKNERIYILGNVAALSEWKEEKAIPLKYRGNGSWSIDLAIQDRSTDILYKYLIKDASTQEVKYYETGDNRIANTSCEETFLVYNDTALRQPEDKLWRGSGISIPVFSLRTQEGCGVGEFLDLIDLGKWAKQAGFSMLQILPIHDTIATKDWTDSYPYAAISVYALHPMYLRLTALTPQLSQKEKQRVAQNAAKLNALPQVDYEAVVNFKMDFLKQYFEKYKDKILKKKNFNRFIAKNQSWLQPYAVFSVLRDKYGTPNFRQWKKKADPSPKITARYFTSKHKKYEQVMFYAFVQWQLHEQLSQAVESLHQMRLTIKGDLPIGIYRYSVEAWWRPELFHLEQQAGAPPDDFAVLGQNWEFPTYNWEKMKENDYCWWKGRLEFMSQYFDAFRMDHILGFFRIWQIPIHATQGILGRFHPALPVTLNELQERGICLDIERLVQPYIDESMLYTYFGEQTAEVIATYFERTDNGDTYALNTTYDTQRKIVNTLASHHPHREALLEIAANVLFIQEENDPAHFHPRFFMEKTVSYQRLDKDTQQKLQSLYVDYFFHRQEDFWKKSGLEKLPTLKHATNMLACGEDLGLVPKVVPHVMHDWAILSLEIQRMPSEDIKYSHPSDAPYLSVVSPSTHDTSTLRQWWKENPENSQYFYNQIMRYAGKAPAELSPELIENIIDQHLYSPAMLSVIPLQEFLGMHPDLRNADEQIERINIPAVFPHYWRYRMHITIEELMAEEDFTLKLKSKHLHAGRLLHEN